MTIGGWLVMLSSVFGVTIFFFWTLYLVMRSYSVGSGEEGGRRLHSVLDEPPDLEKD